MAYLKKLLDQQQVIYQWLLEQPAKLKQRVISQQKGELSLLRFRNEVTKYWEEFVSADETLKTQLREDESYFADGVYNMAKQL